MNEVEEFQGGTRVVRRHGDVVVRPAAPASHAVHRLLRHLHDNGFVGAPEPLGFDDDGNELLTFVRGVVPDALTPELRTTDLLESAARLLRRMHDASVGFVPRPQDAWWLPTREPVEVMCHGDAAQYNCVVRDGRVVAFIDFDAAHPGPRSWDVAYAVYRFAPLQAPSNVESFGSPAEQGRRVALFARAYDEDAGPEIVDVVPKRLAALVDFMRAQAAAGHEAFQRHIREGHVALYETDIEYVRAHRETLRRAFDEI